MDVVEIEKELVESEDFGEEEVEQVLAGRHGESGDHQHVQDHVEEGAVQVVVVEVGKP